MSFCSDGLQHCIFQIPQMMHSNNERRIEIILRAGLASSRMVANTLNRKHGTNITHNTVAKPILCMETYGTPCVIYNITYIYT